MLLFVHMYIIIYIMQYCYLCSSKHFKEATPKNKAIHQGLKIECKSVKSYLTEHIKWFYDIQFKLFLWIMKVVALS